MTEYAGNYDDLAQDTAKRRGERFPHDPWIASSVLQKAIRRGEAELAVRAAFAYARSRGNGIWRRLLVVAFEDVSVGAPAVLLETVDLCAWALNRTRRKVEPDRLEALVRHLVDAPKDRGNYPGLFPATAAGLAGWGIC